MCIYVYVNSFNTSMNLYLICKFNAWGGEFINQIQTEWVCYNYFVSIVCEQIKGTLYSRRRVVVLAILMIVSLCC